MGNAKVYGQASVGAPPMSVPHLDARIIEGKAYTLFGPYAGWSPRFLKTGSLSDWFRSVLSVDGIKADPKDWMLVNAGQRVCIMKPTDGLLSGMLQFGTEVVASKDGSITGLLGASPGASTTV